MAGLQNLNSLFSQAIDNQTSTGVSYIPDLHATGFTINVDGTDFLGIEGSTYLNPGELGFDNDLVDSIADTEAVGFVAQIQPGDDTLFKGVVGNNYNNPGINSGIFYVNDYEEGPTPNFINFTKNRQEKDYEPRDKEGLVERVSHTDMLPIDRGPVSYTHLTLPTKA